MLIKLINRCYQRYRKLHEAEVNIFKYLLRAGYYRLLSKNIYAHQVRGLKKIQTNGSLMIGTSYVGFLNRHDKTFLNINGKLLINGSVHIGKGCRFDISNGAVCELSDCAITSSSTFIIRHSLSVDKGTNISWGCEFLDDDWHRVIDLTRPISLRQKGIKIGEHVWIGSHVKVLKGVLIPNNCIVAANSVVTKPFEEENLLIAGNPARIIRHNVDWT